MNDLEEFLKQRLLIDKNGNIDTKFSDLIEVIKMYINEREINRS